MDALLTVISLFAGIGGFDLGLTRSGMRVVASVEINAQCREILARHFDSLLLGDVEKVLAHVLTAAGFDPLRGLIAGGFPCQGASQAGRRAGLADARTGLFWQICRLASELQPRWLLLENVPHLLHVNGGRDMGIVLRALADLGYGVAWRVLDCQFFGLPQQRPRLVLVGCLGDWASAGEVLLESDSGQGTLAPGVTSPQEAAEHARRRAGGNRRSGNLIISTLQGGGYRGQRLDAESAAGGHLISTAITARYGKGPDSDATAGLLIPAGQGSGVRRLTPLEVQRCQGFPDGWTDGQSDTARYRELGNAFPPQVAEWAGRRILAVEERRRDSEAA